MAKADLSKLMGAASPQEASVANEQNSANTAAASKEADTAAAQTDKQAEPQAGVSTTGNPEPVQRPGTPVEVQQLQPNVQTKDAVEGTKLQEGQKHIVFNPNPRAMRDPGTGDVYRPGEHTRVAELGIWTIIQIYAGILKNGDRDLIGVKPKPGQEDFDGLESDKNSKK